MRRKWIIIIAVLIAVISAFLFTMNIKKQYKSVAQLSTGFTETEVIDPTKAVNYLQSELQFNNAIENMTSPKVLSLVSYSLLLHDLQSDEPFSPMSDSRLDSNNLKREQLKLTLTNYIDSMKLLSSATAEEKKILGFLRILGYDHQSLTKGLTVNRVQKSDYINIEFISNSPTISAFVVNSLFSNFKKFYGTNEKTRSNLSITSLDSLVKQKKAILEQKQLAKQSFASASGVLDANMEGSNKLNQISALESQLITEKGIYQNQSFRVQELNTLIQNLRASGSASTPATTTPSQNTNNEYIIVRKQYNDLLSEYAQTGGTDSTIKRRLDVLSQRMTSLRSSPSTAQPVNNNRASLDDLIQRSIDAKAELEASKTKIGAIETRLSQLKGGISSMAATSAATKQYDDDIALALTEYSEANEQYNLASNYSGVRPDSFKQTLFGQPALQPEPSKRMLIIILAALFAFTLVSGVIIFKEFLDQSIKTPSQFLRMSGLPLLGVVNRIKLNKQNLLDLITAFDNNETSRNNRFLELLRKLRYEIESSGKKTFLFTSTEPQQGKTSIIQAMAFILSLGKKKTLIIDTNFCNNDLTLAIKASPVLEEFEANEADFSIDSLKKLITSTEVAGIDIIGCKGGDYTPSEILPRNHLLNYLDKLKKEYDFIFLEGAPLNGYTDSKELLPYADGLIAIFSAESNFTPADKESIKFLKNNKDKFIGAILNKVNEDNLEM